MMKNDLSAFCFTALMEVYFAVKRIGDNAKAYGIVLGIGLAVFVYNPKVEAALVSGFDHLMNMNGGTTQTIENFIELQPPYGYDNLMIRDSETEEDSVVSKEGNEVWRMGFIKYISGGMKVGGYANNDNSLSNGSPAVLGGWCTGEYTDEVLADGDTADDVMIIHDQLGDGIGNLVGGVWTLGSDDI